MSMGRSLSVSRSHSLIRHTEHPEKILMKSTSKTTTDPQAGSQRRNRRPIHILLSEGSSLSARQTITALGKFGYVLDICDPNPLCISRFSRFIRHHYRCPAVGTDPLGYLTFVLDHLTQQRYDVL